VILGYLLLCLPTTAFASENLILADGPVSTEDLVGHIDYYLDPDWTKTVADMAGTDRESFETVIRNEPDFGYTKDKIWLRMIVKNVTHDQTGWRMHFRENFKQIIDVYVQRENGMINHPLSLDMDTEFTERPVFFPEMVAPIEMTSSETVTIYVVYWSEGSSHLAFSLETVDSFASLAVGRQAKNFIYYGMMAILIIAAFFALLALRESVFLAYVAYALSTVLFLMHSDGLAFQYIWSSFPRFNSVASIATGGALSFFCAMYARVFLQTQLRHPVLDKFLIGFMTIVLSICLSAFFIDPQFIKKSMILLALFTVGLCTISGIVAGRTRFREVRFYILAWLGAVIASLIMNMRHIFGFDITQELEFDSIRIAMVFDASMMGLGIADRFNQLRRSRQKAMQKNLDDAERNLQLNSRLRELEEQYVLASELVQSRDEEMQNTVHDLRQPLHSLRLNVKNLIDKREQFDDDDGTNINETFAYLEDLIASHLQNTIKTKETLSENNVRNNNDLLTTPQVLKSIYEMFLPDAVEKGLSFRFVPTRHHVQIEPLVLMRIISNLVSNAIKYTPSGKILLGCRRRGDKFSIEVHDTGPGMTQEEFEKVLNRDVRLDRDKDRAEGQGYGLAIAKALSEKHGLKLYQDQTPKKGTIIILDIPS